MPRPTAWAAFRRTDRTWQLMLNTVRRTQIEAHVAALGERQGGERTRMSDELRHGVRYKLAPVQISPLPYQTAADKRRARQAARS